jgi:hypothetical protein
MRRRASIVVADITGRFWGNEGMKSWWRAAFGLAASAIIGACANGNGPFQPSPFSGFPPTFTDATLSQYRTQYVADIARFRADRRGFMGSDAAGLACDLSPAQRRQFAADSFMLTPERRTPTWNEIHVQHDVKPTAPVVDRVEVKLLEGDCSGGTVNGRATLHARYLHIVPSTITNVYTVTEVELRETCDYRDLQRTGNCTRYQTHDVRAGFFGADQKLSVATDRPADEAVVFDYGAYDLDRDAGPGVTFAVMQSSFGDETNGATTRAGSADGRMRYEYLAGNKTNLVYTTRDGLLHGPVLLGGSTPGSCYENGERVLRDTCEVQ